MRYRVRTRGSMARVTAGERIDGLVSGDLDTRLVDEVDVAVIATRPGGVVLRWNRHAEQIYGWRADEAVGPHLAGAGDRPRGRALRPAGDAQGVARRHVDRRLPDPPQGRVGRAPCTRGSSRSTTTTGELLAMVGFSTDVTEERLTRGGAPAQRAGARVPGPRQRDPRLVARPARHAAAARRAGGAVHRRRLHGGRAPRGRHDRALRDGGRRRRTARRLRAPAPAPDRPRRRASDRARDALRAAAAPGADRPRGPHAVGRNPGAPGGPAALPGPARNGGSDQSRATGCSGRSRSRCPRAGRTSARTKSRSSRSWPAGRRPRSRTRACTPSARTSRRRCSRACCRRASRASTGFDLAAIYRPAAGGTEVGGDFYDVFETCGGGWGVAIADVCGKGVEAATVTALARHTLRAAALHHAAPAEMLETVNDALLNNFQGAQFCTVALGVVEANGESARLGLTLGGHPAPFILRADGGVEAVGAPGSLLGVLRDPAADRGRDDAGRRRHAPAVHGRSDRDQDAARAPGRGGPQPDPRALCRPQRDGGRHHASRTRSRLRRAGTTRSTTSRCSRCASPAQLARLDLRRRSIGARVGFALPPGGSSVTIT